MSRLKKILLISHSCQSELDGLPRVHALAKNKNLQIRVLVPDRWRHYDQWRGPSSLSSPDFFVYKERVCWPWLGPAQFYLHWYPKLKSILRDFQPDIIDLWEEPWSLVSAQTCWLRDRWLPQARLVSETEQNIYKVLPFPFEQFRNYTLKKVDRVVARSREAEEIIHRQGFTGTIDVIPNGVDSRKFFPLDASQCRKELSLGLSPQHFLVGYAGRLIREKGILDLMRAVLAGSNHWHLLLVGDGPLSQGADFRALEAQLGARLHRKAQVDHTALARVMNALDVFVLPSLTTKSWKEQFGRVIIEAHACAKVVIGSSSGAIPEVIGDGGLVFPEGDVNALKSALEKLSLNRSLELSLGKKGLEQVQKFYSFSAVAEKYSEIYDAL